MDGYLDESFNKETDRYLLSLLSPPDGVLARMEQYALTKKFPFIGPLAGNLLGILARATDARRIFELGSGFGYSALHFARLMPPDGRVICTDGDPENKVRAEKYFADAELSEKLEFHVGDAVSILERFAGPFDIIFMDIDKQGYPQGFRAAWPKLKVGGLFIADNLLWHGNVLSDDQQPTTRGVRDLTKLIYATPGTRTSVVPLRDGVSITVKLF
ncbi:MAG TPA: O-methyltransferase [bacterium]|jgi:predicted O-methyltransferase YrrM